jgi:tripartite-type tricarboxylate transporter receptor subunit TctC
MVGDVRARGHARRDRDRLREASKAAANDERVRQVMTTAGSPILYQDAPEFARYVDADAAKMADVVKKVGKLE